MLHDTEKCVVLLLLLDWLSICLPWDTFTPADGRPTYIFTSPDSAALSLLLNECPSWQEAEKYRMYSYPNLEMVNTYRQSLTTASVFAISSLHCWKSTLVYSIFGLGLPPLHWANKFCPCTTANTIRLNPQAKCSEKICILLNTQTFHIRAVEW